MKAPHENKMITDEEKLSVVVIDCTVCGKEIKTMRGRVHQVCSHCDSVHYQGHLIRKGCNCDKSKKN